MVGRGQLPSRARARLLPSGFLADPSAAPATRPTRRQAVALITVLVLVAAGAALASWLLKPSKAQAFDLFRGSVYIDDARAPVSVDLATGKPTVRLRQANEQVGATDPSDLSVYPLQGGTLLLNQGSGEFNMVDSTGFVIKLGSGVPLPSRPGATTARGVPAGAMAYVVRSGGGRTDVYLVGQATVQAASTPKAHVDPRAYRTLAADLMGGDAALAAANGSLWALTGTGEAHRLWHLVLPTGSNNGAKLTVASSRTVRGPAAVGVATAHSDGSGGDVAALATADHLELFTASGNTSTVSFPTIAGIDTLLSATNQHGRIAFLYHARSGWGLVSVGTDGRHLDGPRPLRGLPADTSLAQPAASLGALYTIDRTAPGHILKVTDDAHVTVLTTYPVAVERTAAGPKFAEPQVFDDAYLVARGPRVIVDSPSHVYAVTLFTDGSSAPVRIDKTAAADVNAAGAIDAIARTHTGPRTGKAPAKPGKVQQPSQPINTALDCAKTTQIPHVPVLTTVDPGSRSVHLEWTYPLLDPQDCVPSTYTLKVELVSANAPAPPGLATVQGQKAVNLVGLFPSTQYRITLTAYINGRGTSAPAVLVTTGPEGPAAPTGVTATATDTGDWVVTWHSCGGVKQGCVPAASWDVLPSYCDGIGLSGPLPPVNVIGDPTLHTFTATYPGGGALLGRSLSFIVQGRGEQDTKGTPSAPSGCVQSWSPPIAAAITFNASVPQATFGRTSTATASVDLGPQAQAAIGGLGGKVTFILAGPAGTTSQTVTYTGKSSVLSATFPGVATGTAYTATARVAPPGHPDASIIKGPIALTTSSAWPAMSLDASCPPSGGLNLTCDLTVTINGLASADAHGELFDLASGSQLVCFDRQGDQTAGVALQKDGFDPSKSAITQTINLLVISGSNCEVDVVLQQSATDPTPLYFGATLSPKLTKPIDLGTTPTLDAQHNDFQVDWDGDGTSNVAMTYTGPYHGDMSMITGSWSEELVSPNGDNCGTDNTVPVPGQAVTVHADPACINRHGDEQGTWTVTISYTNRDGSNGNALSPPPYNLNGPPPSYKLCQPTGLAAAWGPTRAQGVLVSVSPTNLGGCAGWQYSLDDGNKPVCTVSTQSLSSAPPATIDLSNCGTAPAQGWRLTVSWTDPAGTQHDSGSMTISGTPPP